MAVQEREYMKQPAEDPAASLDDAGGVEARSQAEAERLLRFACPTKAADGKWYRVTLALTNVPVCELYNVLSNMSFIAQSLDEFAAGLSSEEAAFIRQKAAQIRAMHSLLERRDSTGSTPIALDGLNVHTPKT